MSPVVVLCCGGRDFFDRNTVFGALDLLQAQVFPSARLAILHGGAKGADSLSGEWARGKGLCEMTIPAPWGFFQKNAGPIRNQWLLDFGRPDYVVAFPGDSGTSDMVHRAKGAGLPVWSPLT